MKKIIFAAFLFLSLIMKSQIISTFLNASATKVDDAMTLDYQGNLYGSNYSGTNVYKISPTGSVSIFASGFNTPNGLAFDSQNNLFICDMAGNRIYKLSHSGIFLDTFFVLGPSGIIKTLNSDTMIFTQYTTDKINKLSPDGSIIQINSGIPLSGPVGLTYDGAGTLYVSNFTDRKVFSLTANNLNYVATLPGNSSNWLGFITYAKGTVWATGFKDQKIYRIYQNYTDSVVLYFGSSAGNVDGEISKAKFNSPNGILASITKDSLYVSDYSSGHIRIISNLNDGIATGLKETALNKPPLVYPNPCENYLQVKSVQKINKIEVYDTLGGLILISDEKNLDVSLLKNGVYFLKVYSETQPKLIKFIKSSGI